MGHIKNNTLTQGISGKVGSQFFFRQVGDKTIVCAKPNRKPTTHPTLIKQNNRFKEANNYAKSSVQDPDLKALYEAEAKHRGLKGAYKMALSDFMKTPEIAHINVSNYTGTRIGESISIEVTDNFKVTAVRVTITHHDEIIEEGTATLLQNDSSCTWLYHTTALNPHLKGTTIAITATDRPQNTTYQEVTIQ
ncbi:hypothetical protein RCZ04_11460 [Capnocytophaga sp. HP1101]